MASKDMLQRQVEKLKEQADAIDKACWPRGVFMREDQSEEDAVREARLTPGEKYFLFRWQTEQERREVERLGMTEKELKATLSKKDTSDEDAGNGAHSPDENDLGHSRVSGSMPAEDGSGRTGDRGGAQADHLECGPPRHPGCGES